MNETKRVYGALSSLRNLQDEFAVFEHNADDRNTKKMYGRCRKQISEVVESLEKSVLHNHGSHGGLDMGIDTGGPINTATGRRERE
jgi:hypothetical protein